MLRVGIRGAGARGLSDALREYKDFRTGGSMRGERTASTWGLGYTWLDREEADRFREDLRKFGALYVVYSYDTPIAWAHGDYRYRVRQRFSQTTGRHQSAVRDAWGETN